MTDLDTLRERAWEGTLTAEELDEVAARLERGGPEESRYGLLLVLGRAGRPAFRYRGLVERFLESPDDPMLAVAALEVLSDDWNETERYRDEVLGFLRGADWDKEREVLGKAISHAGEHLREHDDADFLRELVRLFESEEEDLLERETAYRALCRAAGRDYGDTPLASRHLDWETEIDPAVVERAKERLDRLERGDRGGET